MKMPLHPTRLEDFELKVENQTNNQWRVQFLDNGKTELSATVTVEDESIKGYSFGLNQMKMGKAGLVPSNRITEENQEQRVLDAIKKAEGH